MKNWIVVLSSGAMILNVCLSVDFLNILLSSFTYITSQGLTFYSLNPKTKGSEKRIHILINLSIALVSLNLLGLIFESKISLNVLINLILLTILKVVVTVFSLYVIFCSFADGTNIKTDKEKKVAGNTRKNLEKDFKENQEKNIFSARNSNCEKNEQTRKFVLTKKNRTEETK